MAAKKPAKKKAAKKPAKKAPAKKAAKKKPAARKATAKKAAPAKLVLPTAKVKSKYNKTQIADEISSAIGLARKQVNSVLELLANVIERHVSKGGPGEFVLPGLLKIQTVRKPATKARKGINPFTGEMTTFKAKPARTIVKVRALKKLKSMV
jgi:nucleoid DNA-binding protein